jgi:mannosyltransferase
VLAAERSPARPEPEAAEGTGTGGGGGRPLARRIAEIAAIVVPTALAAGLILYHLGARQLWIDEADTFTTASQHGRLLWHWALNDGGNMVAYYLGMHFYTEVAGTSEVALRLPSAVAGIAIVPVGFLVLRRLFDLRAATFGAFFLAASVPLAWWAQTARGYEAAALFVMASALFMVIAVETRRTWAFVVYVVVSVLAVYTILLAAVVIATQACTLLLRRREEVPWRPVLISGGVLVALSVPAAAAAVVRGTAPIAWLARPGSLFGPADRYFFGILASAHTSGVVDSGVAVYVVWAMAAAWVFGVVLFVLSLRRAGRSRTSWAYLLLIAWLVVPPVLSYIVSVSVHPILNDRYILAAVPAGSMLAGVACSRLRPLPVAVAAGIVLVVMRTWVVVPALGHYLENWRAAVQVVERHSKADDCIAFFVGDGVDPFDYYVLRVRSIGPAPRPVLPATDYASRTPYVLDPAAFTPAGLSKAVASCPRLWLVFSHQGPVSAPGQATPAYTINQYRNRLELLHQIGANYRQAAEYSLIGMTIRLFDRR